MMVDRTRGAGSAKGRTSGAKSKAGGKKGAAKGAGSGEQHANREIAFQKLEELASPILDKYGVTAFDELVSRLEDTVKGYTEEVDALFKEMVSQSREDYERMKSLLTGQDPDEVEQEETVEEEETMSEIEKRLERQEKEKSSAKD
jgi:hypothetical protein